jgi:hypothetical protein
MPHWQGWLAVIVSLSIVAICAAPFFLTTYLTRIALRQMFPANNPRLGAATLSPAGTIVLRDLELFETGPLEKRPLLVVGEMDAHFSWPQLLSRGIRAVHADDIVVYMRTKGSSQISLLDSFLRRPAGSGLPLWVGTLEVQGKIRTEPVRAFTQAQAEWPLSFQMTMSGARENPSRSLHIAVGDIRQLSGNGPKPAAGTNGIFGMLAEVDSQPVERGTQVKVHRIAASNVALTIAMDTLRDYLVKLPSGLKGNVELGLANLQMSGELVFGGGASQKQIHGGIEFAGLRVRVPESTELKLEVDNISGAAKVDSSLLPLHGTSVTIERLQSATVKASIAADLIGQYVAIHPAPSGRIEAGFQNLQVSGELNQSTRPNRDNLTCNITLSGLHVLVPGRPRPILSIGDLSGAVKISTPLPLGNLTTIAIDGLKATSIAAAMEAGAVRQYTAKLPTDLRGPIDANLDALSLSGRIGSAGRETAGFSGDIRIQNLSVASSPSQEHSFALDRLTVAGNVESRLNRWMPEVLKVRHGLLKFAGLTYRNNTVNDFDASWQIDAQVLSTDHFSAKMFEGYISGAPAFDLLTYAMPPRDFGIKSIEMHRALANLSPDHIDAEGKASGVAHLVKGVEGDLSGSLNLTFDGPGVLKIGQVEEVKQMLVGNFGLSMANLAMRDLQRYPFKEGALSLESLERNSQLKIKFVRQPRTKGDVTTPHKEVINGQEVLVGSLVVPSIDMTIPITGKSLAEILAMVSGVHPAIQTVGKQPTK